MAGEWNGIPCWAHNPRDNRFDSCARYMNDKDKRTFHRLISEQTGHEPEEINDELQFLRDLHFDSLDVIELVMAVEEEFRCSIPDGDFIETHSMTVADAIKIMDDSLARWKRVDGRVKSE